jgi:hypothetical protein
VLAGLPFVGALTAWCLWHADANMPVAVASGAAMAGLLGWVGLRLEARYSMYWMMRSYAFTARQAVGQTPDLEARLDAQAERLAERLREGADDEVLVVGHSSGAIMGAIIVARALQRTPELGQRERPMLSLLTLGQWIPLLGLLPQAGTFRQELTVLATAPKLEWIDFSAPPDGCCFALTDPVAGSGLDLPNRAADRPKLLSPRFAQMFNGAAYAALKRDKFRMHFQYLMASPVPVEYDYFRITAGARTLQDRYAGQDSTRNFNALRVRAMR